MNDLYNARLQRTLNAIHMEPVDKIPFSYNGPAYLAHEMGLTLKEYHSDYARATDAVLGFLQRHPQIDTIHTPINCPYGLVTLWLSPVKVPGKELPEDELWQMDEQEIVTYEDYVTILKEGFGPWVQRVMKERLGDPVGQMGPYLQYQPITVRRLAEAGLPVMNTGSSATPFEHMCGGRTLMNFFIDLVEEPELIKQVLDKVMEYDLSSFERQLAANHPLGVWIGGWRGAPELLSHDTWMEFVWPYLKKMILTAIDYGTLPILHFDSCWDKELETLRELPPRKCLLMLDGSTDIRLARKVLDDRMCLMGDVPARLLAFGTPSEVYGYVTRLIDDVGPRTGLIVSSGCDTPFNARPENVAAMIQATQDYRPQ